ncbi:MAG: aspartate--ammonia ligase [Erysipelotrichaceae bacterium]|mgnify:CR=1 FL=1
MTMIKPGLFVPEEYNHPLDIRETEHAIKYIKDYFEKDLALKLKLTRVSAPLFVRTKTGLNDNLNGIERPVSFDIKNDLDNVEIVHSLAKWKRSALKRYGFQIGEGLYTDMNAIRRDEDLDNLHSIYVDQWDWEKNIDYSERNEDVLKETVRVIYQVMKDTEQFIFKKYRVLKPVLPQDIFFITSQELEDLYPSLSPKEREDAICLEKKAVFIMQIGDLLKSNQKHDGRAPDYDDWKLNGDILVYNPILKRSFELSSMGIRVDEKSLLEQLTKSNCLNRLEFPFHKAIMDKDLPYSMGGGIGQSRLCMFYLQKAHIGEVQASIWPEDIELLCEEKNIKLL